MKRDYRGISLKWGLRLTAGVVIGFVASWIIKVGIPNTASQAWIL